MLFQHFIRALHTTKVEKSALAALRKKTGYTFANCKKALEMHNNDSVLAEKWLSDQAQSLGWSKATKLAERVTAQGLVGVLIRNNVGAMVEVNCETDFVARNEHFRNFVEQVSRTCVQYTDLTDFDGDLWKLGFEADAIKNLKTDDGKSLADHLALLIGTVGENATIKRAICFKTSDALQLTGYAHPAPIKDTSSSEDVLQFGRYGVIAAIHGSQIDEELKKNLCQHIVGLNPQKIGELGVDTPIANKDEETCLIHQEYLIDADKTFGDVLNENNISILDYQRYECGEAPKASLLDEANFNVQI